MSNPKICIIIVTWNSLNYLSYCLESIFNQSFKDFSVIIVDNGSTDETIKFVKKEYSQVAVLKNHKNLGFAHANNQGIKLSNSEYILLCNPDVILEKDFLEQAVKTLETNDKIASTGGKLLKVEWATEELPKPVKTDIIDSCGLELHKSHYCQEIGPGEKDQGKYNKIQEVFGITGALALYRLSALKKVEYDEEYFDENFFSYKEDIDLAWRLRLIGYHAIYNPLARAYHFRGVSQTNNRKTRPKLINQLSYKNHLLTLIKNQTFTNLILFSLFIFWYEFKKLIYLVLFEQSTLPALVQFLKQLPSTFRKRKHLMSTRQVSSKEIRHWFK